MSAYDKAALLITLCLAFGTGWTILMVAAGCKTLWAC